MRANKQGCIYFSGLECGCSCYQLLEFQAYIPQKWTATWRCKANKSFPSSALLSVRLFALTVEMKLECQLAVSSYTTQLTAQLSLENQGNKFCSALLRFKSSDPHNTPGMPFS